MIAKKGRISAIVLGIIFYFTLLLYGITNYYPKSFVLNIFFLIPAITLFLTFVINMLFPSKKSKTIPNDEEISGIKFLNYILVPIVLGFIAIFYVLNGKYTEIDWVVIALVVILGLIGKDLIFGRSER
jgi:hypothetical protein